MDLICILPSTPPTRETGYSLIPREMMDCTICARHVGFLRLLLSAMMFQSMNVRVNRRPRPQTEEHKTCDRPRGGVMVICCSHIVLHLHFSISTMPPLSRYTIMAPSCCTQYHERCQKEQPD